MSTAQGLAAPAARRVPLATRLAYGSGSLAYGIKDSGFSTLLMLFYNQVIGLPAEAVGAVLMAVLIADAFIDPVIGQLSDSTRTRWGRRHPFMYAAALPVGALYVLLWHPPAGSQAAALVHLAVCAMLVRTAISCYEVPSSALAPELTSDYHERTLVLGTRHLFGWTGGVAMALLAFGVFLRPDAEHPVGQLNRAGYADYALCAGVLMVLSILLSAAGTHREIARLPLPPVQRVPVRVMFRQALDTVRNRAFGVLMLAGVFAYTSQGLVFALSTYFNTYLWQFPAPVLAVFSVCVLFGVGLALVAATRVSRRMGKRRAALLLALAHIVFLVGPYLARLGGWMPPVGHPALLPLLAASTLLAAALGVGSLMLVSSMLSDVVEESQARTGRRSEGLFFAGSAFVQKCVAGVGLFLTGLLLAWAGFPEAAEPGAVPEPVLLRLVLAYCVAITLLSLASVAVLRRFPITQQAHERRVAALG